MLNNRRHRGDDQGISSARGRALRKTQSVTDRAVTVRRYVRQMTKRNAPCPGAKSFGGVLGGTSVDGCRHLQPPVDVGRSAGEPGARQRLASAPFPMRERQSRAAT